MSLIQECICGDSNFDYQVTKDLEVGTCSSCGVLHQNLNLTEEQYYNQYDGSYYEGRVELRRLEETEAAKLRYNEYLKRILNFGERVLDIGCGLSGFVDYLRTKKIECWGQDIHSRGRNNTTYIGELESINFPTDYFNVITLHDVIEHIIDPVNLILEAKRITKQDGYIIVDLPDYFNDDGRHHWRKKEHLWLFSPKQLADIFQEKCGLKIKETYYPIPGKITFILQKDGEKRTSLLIPPGIGDIYWVLCKMESFLRVNNIGMPNCFLQNQGPKNRSLDYVQRFPFLHAADYSKSGVRSQHWREAYKEDGRSIFLNDRIGYDYFIMFNGPMRFDKTLEEICPELEVNWRPRMFHHKSDEVFGKRFHDFYGDFIIGYISNVKMYQSWIQEFTAEQIAEAFKYIHETTGYKILLVGKEWDLKGPSHTIGRMYPEFCIDLVNTTSFSELMGMFQYTKGIIGFPSGITIIASSFNIPIVMIWNRYFREPFWKNSCPPDVWNRTYKAVNSFGLSSRELSHTFLNLIQ